MVLPSLARLSIERAAPTAAPSDAPTDAPSAEDVLERLAQQEQAAVDAFVSRLEEPPAPGEPPPLRSSRAGIECVRGEGL